ncbi:MULTISPECIES: transcriptional repressor LexA [unclassified Luteimonas]|uniref:transcriptional repressor LexA n=1 Tax=unclassified Luteimonas TaxID=2629088 RepID=UPI0018F0D018|nr:MULTISPECIES: transcriptional repressor LexA [unclassified Luteimonas]MBJ6982674.1 transcriptional repressor LexA [Luteimonas sp. MC1572]MBJ7574743.1 transcriptional repressor LexA [Luteimonas sp. MC1828]QQO03916.1 transcriptional repressor LexA [Luteimonas sp. MC1572]
MTDDLTPRQRDVLGFIQAHAGAEGAPPTLQQIADAFGFRQACAAHKHVRRLQAAGYLEVRPNEARGIRVVAGMAQAGGGRAGRARHVPGTRLKLRDDRLELPVLGRVAAGAPIGADAGVERHVLLDRALFTSKPDYLLRVKGDSMRDDGIFDGDLVAVQRASDARNGQVVVARVDGEITIKRLERTRTRLRLLPRNPDYAPIEVPPGSDFAIEGLYCGLVRTA